MMDCHLGNLGLILIWSCTSYWWNPEEHPALMPWEKSHLR